MDKKDIYCITNNINGMQYVGQSKDAHKRFKAHALAKDKTYFHSAIRKYGIDNFDMEILEHQTSNYNLLEQYWIETLDTIYPNGYNIAKGGAGYPHMNGSLCYQSLLNETELSDIKELLSNTNMTQTEIANRFNVTQEIISSINCGNTYFHKNWEYPLRNYEDISENNFQEIKDLLQNTTLSFEKIASKVGVGKSTINSINKGKILYHKNEEYPLRKYSNKSKLSDENILLQIKKMLEDNEYSTNEIGAIFNVGRQSIEQINQGKSHIHENWDYPLRKKQKPNSNLKKEDISEIKSLLFSTKLSFREIGRQFGVQHSVISNINNGISKAYRDDKIKYPIRKR